MTQCIQSEFEFKGHFSRRVGAAFDGGTMTPRQGLSIYGRHLGGAVLLK